jgi:hypothetical protein
VSPIAAAWLFGSLLGLVILDWAAVRLLLEALRPASAYVFWAGRAGKVIAVIAWFVFFNRFWWPEFVRTPLSPLVPAGEVAVVGALVFLGFVTLPRKQVSGER